MLSFICTGRIFLSDYTILIRPTYRLQPHLTNENYLDCSSKKVVKLPLFLDLQSSWNTEAGKIKMKNTWKMCSKPTKDL